jgi:hypothetical protein
MKLLWIASAAAFALGLQAQSLDYEAFKTKVEPVFAKKRQGHARCVSCHSAANNAFRLEPIEKGSAGWSEEQSRKNFEAVSRLVKPGDPEKSILLKHPLSKEAGGDEFHSGGRQFVSKDDPDFKVIAEWIGHGK